MLWACRFERGPPLVLDQLPHLSVVTLLQQLLQVLDLRGADTGGSGGSYSADLQGRCAMQALQL